MHIKPSFLKYIVLLSLTSSLCLHAAILDDLVEKIQQEANLKSHTHHRHHKYRKNSHSHRTLSQEAQYQTALRFLGYYTGKIDGDLLTPESFNAVTAFHEAHGQINTGFLEEEDKRYLSKVYHTITMERYLSYEGSNKRKQHQRLQAALAEEGYYAGKIDGRFKKHSKAAFARYKERLADNNTTLDDKAIQMQLIENARVKVGNALKKIKETPYDPADYENRIEEE